MDAMNNEKSVLKEGLQTLNLEADQEQLGALLDYVSLLRHWNSAYNLVAAGDEGQLVNRHVLDSLSIQPLLKGESLLDVGTGAGFPGIPLAIMNPGMRFTLVDSSGKKVRFLRHVIRTLGLGNVDPVHSRIQRFSPGAEFSTITSRAFASLRRFAEDVRHLAGPETRLLAMKGRQPEGELEELPDWIEVIAMHRLEVPGPEAERRVVEMAVTPQ